MLLWTSARHEHLASKHFDIVIVIGVTDPGPSDQQPSAILIRFV
jgi:hypothetical protein